MNEQSKKLALGNLYRRFEDIAEDMGGDPRHLHLSRAFPASAGAAPRSEEVPGLQIKMEHGFGVELGPTGPLCLGTSLDVTARRSLNGEGLDDWTFRFNVQDGLWYRGEGQSLSDDEIGQCLAP
ncbi:MAG: hypothetical protein ACP5EP_08550 [Acidobacteriaceae bacterium]